MPTYRYRVRTQAGDELSGFMAAPSLPALGKQLADCSLRLIWADEFTETRSTRAWSGRVAALQVSSFFRQLGSVINAGAPLADGLRVLALESRDRRFARIIEQVRADVQNGLLLSEAVSRHPRAFGRIAPNLLRAAEEAGALGDACIAYADHIEQFASLAYDVSAALAYPAIVALVATLAVTFLMCFVVPKYIGLFEELGVTELPTITAAIYWLARHQGVTMALIVVPTAGLAAIYLLYRRTRSGPAELDALKLRLPLLGDIVRAAALGRLSSSLAVLTRNEVPLLTALELAAGATGSAPLAQALRMAQRDVREGQPLARSLESTSALPAVFVWRAAVGESTGQLPEAFEALADHYRGLTRQLTRHFSVLIEPLLIILIAIFVGAIVLGLFAPLLSIVGSLAA